MNNRQHTQATPRTVPAVCAVATLVGAVLWSEATLVAGLAVVGMWAPVATVLRSAGDKLTAAAVADRLRSPARVTPK